MGARWICGLRWITPRGTRYFERPVKSPRIQSTLVISTAIKKDKGVRDWSHLIPGQGGFLDQLDSVIFAAPVFYHLTHLMWGV